MHPLYGILNVNKPIHWTSRDVVSHVQQMVRPSKVGHAGTLDPLATGVLLVTLGKATRLTSYLHRLAKYYRAEFQLGCRSDTDDIQGQVVPLPETNHPTRDELLAALPQFVGRISQRPCAYSAVKLAGRRAYQLARQGRAVALEPRQVDVHALDLIEYTYPTLVLDVHCGSGVYVRALGRDLAESLGTAAVMTALERRSIGPFRIGAACTPDSLIAERLSEQLRPALEAVAHLPKITLSAQDQARIARGQTITCSRVAAAARELAAVDSTGQLLAILVRHHADQFRPQPNLVETAGG